MKAARRDSSIVSLRPALLAALLLALPLAAAAQSAPAPAGSTAPIRKVDKPPALPAGTHPGHDMHHGATAPIDHGSMPGMDHGSMNHGTPSAVPAASAHDMSGPDHSSTPGLGHGLTHGTGMVMESGQGDHAPTEARSGDYSDGIAASPAHTLHMHGSAPASMLLIDQLEAFHGRDANGQSWEAAGWYGSDTDKLWLRSEGERSGGRPDDGEVEALWDHAVAAFWSTQLGVRHDFGTGPRRNWAAFGVQGLAPYWFEIQATAYVGPSGRSAMRVRADYELLFTQRLILQPELEVNLHGKSDPARGIGCGLTDATLGLRLRYEIRREFAPYIGITWTQRFGATADFAREERPAVFDRQWVAGLRIWF